MIEFEDVAVSGTNDENAEIVNDEEIEEITFDDTDNDGGKSTFESEGDDEPDAVDIAKKKKKKKLIIFGSIAAAIIVIISVCLIVKAVKSNDDGGPKYKDAAVERRTISNTITGSSSIEPNDSYSVTTMKSGDIDADYFKEGDTVKKGDKLYQFDDEDAQKSLTSAKNSVTKAEQSYADALKSKSQTEKTNTNSKSSAQNALTKAQISLNDAKDTYNKQYVKAGISGKVKEVYVSKGETISNGTKIAEIYNDSSMKLVLPFNANDADSVYIGAGAEVSVVGTGETLYGTVTEKASSAAAGSYHTSVVYVTVEISNPGALTEEDSGSAIVNGAACADAAKFEYISSRTVIAEVAGTVDQLNVIAGDSVSSGTQIAYINSTQAQTSLKNAQLSYDDAILSMEKQTISSDTYSQDSNIKNAKLSLEDAKVQLQKAEDEVADYLIEAPIDGTVVTKNAKAGDTIDTANSQTALCVIYDLSCVKFSIDVDETEVALVKTGQKVKVTADAVDGEFEGYVIKVPVDGVNTNGVTTYTVEVQIDNYGDLLPGMNVDAEITVEEAENVLAVPVNSVNRGNIVFVKDDGTERENDVTDIINGGKEEEGSEDSDNKDDKSSGKKDKSADANQSEQSPQQKSPSGTALPMASGAPSGVRHSVPEPVSASKDSKDAIPMNIEIPEGYRAIQVETGINDTEYIEIKSGLTEGDTVRALDTESSSAGASFGNGEEAMNGMNGMGGMSGGGMGGGMGGSPGGGMGGGGRSGGGMGGGMR